MRDIRNEADSLPRWCVMTCHDMTCRARESQLQDINGFKTEPFNIFKHGTVWVFFELIFSWIDEWGAILQANQASH